ncbi:unnamed protein product [Sphagnum jensenii]|uniref:Uncharacterized protein n=1 Tax=Sphagnum jensenii TaxID=128206 RepID=A0ABP0VK45_9BRYO
MERNKKTKRRVTNEEEEGASNSSSSRESSDRPPSPFERICCCNNGGGARWNEGAEPQGRCSRRRDARALSRVCCATGFWSQTEVRAQEFDRIQKRHQKHTHSGPELCQQFAACMYLCSSLRLA